MFHTVVTMSWWPGCFTWRRRVIWYRSKKHYKPLAFLWLITLKDILCLMLSVQLFVGWVPPCSCLANFMCQDFKRISFCEEKLAHSFYLHSFIAHLWHVTSFIEMCDFLWHNLCPFSFKHHLLQTEDIRLWPWFTTERHLKAPVFSE